MLSLCGADLLDGGEGCVAEAQRGEVAVGELGETLAVVCFF